MSGHASNISALVTGFAVIFPALAKEYIESQFIVILVWAGYIAFMFIFVFGPQQWDAYRWVPVDETHIVIGRAILWVLSGGVTVGALEGIHAI